MADLGKAYVQIIPSAEGIKGGIEKTLDPESTRAGTSAGKNIGGKITGALKTAAKVGGAALVAGVGLAIKAGGQLEQSIGGVQTLFKSSADTVIKNADRAYKTAQISSNSYMQAVTGFSASLIQSLGGNTKEAANLANRAVIDMSDNANKMGTDMGLIMQTYQSLARGNYAMLDNLKLGYGGTKSEMQRLIHDASTYTKEQKDMNLSVKDGDMSFGNMVKAISVVQKHLGITGTSAKEASTTLEGSFNQMKAAAENFAGDLALNRHVEADLKALGSSVSTFLIGNLLPMLGRIVQALPAALSGIVKSAGSIFKELLPQLTSSLPGLASKFGEALGQLAAYIISHLPQIVAGIFQVLQAVVAGAFTGLIGFVMGLFDGIDVTGIFSAIGDAFIAVWDGIKAVFSGVIAGFKADFQGFADAVSIIWQGIATVASTIWNAIKAVVGGVINGFKADFQGFASAVSIIWNGIVSGVTTAFSAVASVVATIFGAIKSIVSGVVAGFAADFQGFAAAVSIIWNAILSTAISIWTAISTAIGTVVVAVVTVVTSVWSSLSGTVSGIFSGILGVASSIWNGIKTAITSPIQAAEAVVTSVVNGIKAVMQFAGTPNAVSGVFGSIASSIGNKLRGALNTVRSVIGKIKSALNFTARLGNIKLPHISVNGGTPPYGIGGKGSLPKFSVNWYAKGGIFDNPSLIGVGEAGPEAVVPLDKLWVRMDNATNLREAEGMTLINQLNAVIDRLTLIADASTSETTIRYNGREFGRLVRSVQ